MFKAWNFVKLNHWGVLIPSLVVTSYTGKGFPSFERTVRLKIYNVVFSCTLRGAETPIL